MLADGERKSSCGVCGARLGPGVAQAHFLQELQHLYSLSALPRDAAAPPSHSLHHQDEDARWEVSSPHTEDLITVETRTVSVASYRGRSVVQQLTYEAETTSGQVISEYLRQRFSFQYIVV